MSMKHSMCVRFLKPPGQLTFFVPVGKKIKYNLQTFCMDICVPFTCGMSLMWETLSTHLLAVSLLFLLRKRTYWSLIHGSHSMLWWRELHLTMLIGGRPQIILHLTIKGMGTDASGCYTLAGTRLPKWFGHIWPAAPPKCPNYLEIRVAGGKTGCRYRYCCIKKYVGHREKGQCRVALVKIAASV